MIFLNPVTIMMMMKMAGQKLMKAQGKRRVKGVQELVDNEKGEVLGSKKGAEGIP